MDRIFERYRTYGLEPPPNLHAQIRRLGRQLMQQRKPWGGVGRYHDSYVSEFLVIRNSSIMDAKMVMIADLPALEWRKSIPSSVYRQPGAD